MAAAMIDPTRQPPPQQEETASTMLACVCTKYGPAGTVFEIRSDVPRPPSPEDHEILVNIAATTVNPADCKQRSGNLSLISKHEFPFVLGQDFSGRIVEVGPMVTKFSVGDAVMGSTAPRNGCSAEYVLTHETECAPKPLGVSNEIAAAVPTAYCTAWKGLFGTSLGNLSIDDNYDDDNKHQRDNNRDKSLLVIGASGSVGSAAVQLAKNVAGCGRVAAICGPANIEYAKSMGADPVVDYSDPGFAEGFRAGGDDQGFQFDLILDCVGGDFYYKKLHPFLRFSNPKARYVTCVGPVLHGGSEPITVKTLLKTAVTLLPRLTIGNCFLNSRYSIYLGFETGNGALEGVARALEHKSIDPRLDPTSLSLNDLGRAHEIVETGHSQGKVTVTI